MRTTVSLTIGLHCLTSASVARAHTSEQGFVLLLPTDVYIATGVFTVVLTIIALLVLPASCTRGLFTPLNLFRSEPVTRLFAPAARITQFCALLILIALIGIGFIGTHDPLRNLLPLSIWTVFWMGLISLNGVIGNLWHAINPFRPCTPLGPGYRRFPSPIGSWPGMLTLLLFSAFFLADTAPEDPVRLAWLVTGYVLYTFFACYLFGSNDWLQRGECFSMIMQRMAEISPIGLSRCHMAIGFPGWKSLQPQTTLVTMSGALFTLTMLAAGSFDGVNETFWWLQRLGINPLEFPGRSSVVWQTVAGLLLSVFALIVCFALCVLLGTALGNRQSEQAVQFSSAFGELSIAIIPIALAYHFAHYLTSFMVNIQYTVAALSDPLQNGRDLLGLGTFYVTTGFFNTQSSVRTIWLTQAGAVLCGHVLSLLLSHRIAQRLWSTERSAALSQIPLAIFMVLYTLLGLWLLAAPRGA